MSDQGQVKRPKLTIPQADLLAEIVETGTLYITRYGRYWRTIDALTRKGYVRCSENDWHYPGFVAVPIEEATSGES